MVPSTRVVSVSGKAPSIGKNVFVAPSASVVGDVTVGDGSSVWYNSVLRSDKGAIKIGQGSNIQERVVVAPKTGPVTIGDKVTVGASAQLDSCTLQDGCMVGVGVQVASGAVVETGSVVTAGSVVPQNARVHGTAGLDPARTCEIIRKAGIPVENADEVSVSEASAAG